MDIPKEEWPEWWDCRDRVSNLQLLNGLRNISKNATPLDEWLAGMSPTELRTFAADNYFPEGVGLEFKHFRAFYRTRKEILRRELRKLLTMDEQPSATTTESTIASEAEMEPRPDRPTAEVLE